MAANGASLQAQTCDDFAQVVLNDDVGRGMAWAQAQLASYEPHARYVWILDDDDVCIRDTLVEELQTIAAEHDPDVIMLRMDHGPLGVLPDDAHWRKAPAFGFVGVSAFVVRRQLWTSCAFAWRTANYNSDFAFATALFSKDPSVYWHDVVASKVQRISQGAAE